MPRGQVIRIGAWIFSSKQAAEKHIRGILARHGDMQQLKDEDEEFVRAIIDLHPRRTVIVDCGIAWIFVQYLPGSARRFVVRRTDSSWRDFSWQHVLYPRDADRRLASVLRTLIRPVVEEFKERNFRGVCENETCGIAIQIENCHVDHAYPATFEALQDGWLRSLRLTAADIAIQAFSEYEVPDTLEDILLREAWFEYHELHARLRCVCRRCNLSTLRMKVAV